MKGRRGIGYSLYKAQHRYGLGEIVVYVRGNAV